MAFNTIILEKEPPLAIITINRPPVNALNPECIGELTQAFKELRDDASVRVIIITGAGQYTFVAGADISSFGAGQGEPGEAAFAQIRNGQKLFTDIETYPKPVIAAINGVCLGGGNELAMGCDLRIAAESARFGQPEINLGIIPGWGGTQRLPRLIGKTKAMELLLTGDMIKAPDALRVGLVNKVVPDSELLTTAKNVGRMLATKAPIAMAAIKKAVFQGLDASIEEGLDVEFNGSVECFKSEDGVEGITAFLQKRKPQFKGK
ncbi:MAG TPA: enoyl-CoA hydratase-related protein [Bacillota bacterium]|jgi:enoyl-CoA hydratase/carnithine racemase